MERFISQSSFLFSTFHTFFAHHPIKICLFFFFFFSSAISLNSAFSLHKREKKWRSKMKLVRTFTKRFVIFRFKRSFLFNFHAFSTNSFFFFPQSTLQHSVLNSLPSTNVSCNVIVYFLFFFFFILFV